ncbi:MAG: VWA domain-containing protein [Bacteroidia bacterium]|nr:VWA domain-containing protein [Bacteroidia bacterium]
MKTLGFHIIILIMTLSGILSVPPYLYGQHKQAQSFQKGLLIPANPVIRTDCFSQDDRTAHKSILFYDNFESGNGNWSFDGCWGIGNPTSGPGGGYESLNCAATNLDGDYPNYANDWMISISVVLPDINIYSELKLNFMEWFQLESGYDNGRIKVSLNDGISWTEIYAVSGSSEWRQTELDLSSFSNKTIQLAFNITSDYSVTESGWYIDNIQIIYEEFGPLLVTITSLNAQNFPFIYMNVTVDSLGVGLGSLNKSNFEIRENDVLQTDFFEVIPPDTGIETRLTDIIFVLDVTSSMEGEIGAVRENMLSFVNALASSQIDYNIGFVVFGDIVYVYNSGNLYTNQNDIISVINNIQIGEHGIGSGGDEAENSLEAMANAANMNFRPGSQKIQIMLTDSWAHENNSVTPWTVETLLEERLIPNHILVFPVFDVGISEALEQFVPIAEATNPQYGSYYYIYDNFNDIISQIGELIANSYLVRYKSSDSFFNNIERNVEVIVNHFDLIDTAYASYIPGAVPEIFRTESTLALHDQSWIAGTSFTIEVAVIDRVEPFVSEVKLLFKNTVETTYQSVYMVNTLDSLWQGEIAGTYIFDPGIDYYITATDGQSTSSDPSVDPINKPYQISILPNIAPQIIHTPIGTLTPDSPIKVEAQITDSSNKVIYAGLFYRKIGQLSYQQTEMMLSGENSYTAVIPSEYVTVDGLEYYLWAVDDFDVGSFHGTPDIPHIVEPMPDFGHYIEEKLSIINYIKEIERPFLGTSTPFFEETEEQVLNFVEQVHEEYNNGTANPLDLEATGRLVLSERIAYHGLHDAVNISDYGAQGIKSIVFLFVFKNVLNNIDKVIKHIPGFVGGIMHDGIIKFQTKLSDALYKLFLSFNKGMIYPPGQITIPEYNKALEMTNTGLVKSEDKIARFIGGDLLLGGIFETGEDIVQEYVYLWTLEMQTQSKQNEALINAQSQNFPPNSFNGVEEKMVNTLFSLQSSNQVILDSGFWVNTLREVSGWLSIIAAFVIVVAAIVAAFGTGGSSLLAAIAGLAYIVLQYSTLVANTSAIVEAAGSAIYVNGVMPYGYINPSVDDAFGDGTSTDADNNKRTYTLYSSYLDTIHSKRLNIYYEKLKQQIMSGDTAWATHGMDSLAYYEELSQKEEMIAIARFFASADSASNIILNYQDILNSYIMRSAAEDILSGSLILDATLFRAGYNATEMTNLALTSLDSLIYHNNSQIALRSEIEGLLSEYNIPSPNPVGVGKLNGKRNSSVTVELSTEIINYGSQDVEKLSVEIYLTDTNAVIINNNQEIDIAGNNNRNITFNILSGDSLLVGMVILRPDSSVNSYFTLPPKIFMFTHEELTQSIYDNDNDFSHDVRFYPNPFNPNEHSFKITYKLKESTSVTAEIYDLKGRLIKTLFVNKQQPGCMQIEIEWDGTNNQSQLVSNGMYLYVIKPDRSNKIAGKVVITK